MSELENGGLLGTLIGVSVDDQSRGALNLVRRWSQYDRLESSMQRQAFAPVGPVLVDASADVEVDAGRVIPGVFYPGWLFFVFLHLE